MKTCRRCGETATRQCDECQPPYFCDRCGRWHDHEVIESFHAAHLDPAGSAVLTRPITDMGRLSNG